MNILSFWWVIIPIVVVIGYKWILRFLCGMVIIPEDKVGLVTKKFVLYGKNKSLPEGRIIALNGEAGYQVDPLAPGIYFGYWFWQYIIDFQVFVEIPKGEIGLVVAKDGAELPTGSILARNRADSKNFQDGRAFLGGGGQKGKQTRYINTGKYRINTFLFDITRVPITEIQEGQLGIITSLDGQPLEPSQIAGREIPGHNNFQDIDKFLADGGHRGLQTQVILAGSYTVNTWAVTVQSVSMTEIPIGNVGVVISFVGDEGQDQSGANFKHGNIVKTGQKGVWEKPLDPGRYPINPFTHKVLAVPTTNLVLNWANARNEAHKLDEKLSTITVRSKDGFPFNLDVSQIIHIPAEEAPKVIARFGSIQNLVSQVLEPTIGNYFRNSAQNSDVIAFLSSREERQKNAKATISAVLDSYNVHAVDTLIGDITPPAELMRTLTDRKIAQEQETTYETEMNAQKVRQKLESETALANMQGQIVTATQSVSIAERNAEATVKQAEGQAKSVVLAAKADAEKTQLTGAAEASRIKAIGEATAEAYTRQVQAMGADNFAKYKIVEEIGRNKTKIIPEIYIGGSGGADGATNPISALLGFELLKRSEELNRSEGKQDTKG